MWRYHAALLVVEGNFLDPVYPVVSGILIPAIQCSVFDEDQFRRLHRS